MSSGCRRRSRALTQGEGTLDVRLCQLVNLLDGGKPMKMSKRAGRIVTLRDVVDEVGARRRPLHHAHPQERRAARFRFRQGDRAVEGQPGLLRPVRPCADLLGVAQCARGWAASRWSDRPEVDLGLLADPAELALLREMASFPRVLEGAAQQFEPHRVAFYLYDLASAFHGLWARGNEDTEPAVPAGG